MEQLSNGVVRLSFAGQSRMGSEGNPDGQRMQKVIREVLANHNPSALLIDLTNLEYRFGDWIGAVLLGARAKLGRGRVCVLATGETALALRSLLEFGRIDRLISLEQDVGEALRCLSGAISSEST